MSCSAAWWALGIAVYVCLVLVGVLVWISTKTPATRPPTPEEMTAFVEKMSIRELLKIKGTRAIIDFGEQINSGIT